MVETENYSTDLKATVKYELELLRLTIFMLEN